MKAVPMRAKMRVTHVDVQEATDFVSFAAVCKSGLYPEDGSDEDNTFAKFSPSADLKMAIANPELLGHFRPGYTFYVDFTPVPVPAPEAAEVSAQ